MKEGVTLRTYADSTFMDNNYRGMNNTVIENK